MAKDYTRDTKLLQNIEQAICVVEALPKTGAITLEELQHTREIERQKACQDLDDLAKLFTRQDTERKKLWGNKYPLRLGDKPPDPPKPINPVKAKKAKRRK